MVIDIGMSTDTDSGMVIQGIAGFLDYLRAIDREMAWLPSGKSTGLAIPVQRSSRRPR